MAYIKYLSLLCMTILCNMNKKERTVVHVEYGGRHFYFGSFSAIYTKFTVKELGVALGTLRNYGVKEDKPYQNSNCTIRKGVLVTMPKGVE
mgnify:FL=1